MARKVTSRPGMVRQHRRPPGATRIPKESSTNPRNVSSTRTPRVVYGGDNGPPDPRPLIRGILFALAFTAAPFVVAGAIVLAMHIPTVIAVPGCLVGIAAVLVKAVAG